MAWVRVALDRSAVLLMGVAVGTAIGFAFGGSPSALPAGIAAAPLPMGTACPARTDPMLPPEVAAARACAMPYAQQLLETVAADRPIRIGVFGDSYGDGVWSGLARLLPHKDGYDVVKFSKQATGFTRYRSLNLEKRLGEQIGREPIDVAVISFGANDAQGVITEGGKYAELMTPPWQELIGRRIDGFVAELRRHRAMVYWVGLPRMREAKYDGDVGAINGFYARKMAQLGVPFVDTRPLVAGPDGGFAAYLDDPKTGQQTLIRAPDGIHMSMNGYVWITRGLAGRIRQYVDAMKVMAGKAPAPAASPTPSPTPSPTDTRRARPTPTPSPTATRRPRPRPTATSTPTPAAVRSPRPEPNATPTPRASRTPRPEPSATPTPRAVRSPRPEPSANPSPRPSATARRRPLPSPTPRTGQ